MYRRAIERILGLPEDQRDEFKKRLKVIVTSSAQMGWGYHDAICDDYYSAFPEDE
jgi:hypothetical protein